MSSTVQPFEAGIKTIPGLEAGVDLSSLQFHFVKLDGNNQVIPCDTLGEDAIGVLQDKPSTVGQAASVAYEGQTKCEAGATIAGGDDIAVLANAKAKVTAPGEVDATGGANEPLKGSFSMGTALTDAASGEFFTLQIDKKGATPQTLI